jgi:hypothetical protein
LLRPKAKLIHKEMVLPLLPGNKIKVRTCFGSIFVLELMQQRSSKCFKLLFPQLLAVVRLQPF